jgi:hypothetical protein
MMMVLEQVDAHGTPLGPRLYVNGPAAQAPRAASAPPFSAFPHVPPAAASTGTGEAAATVPPGWTKMSPGERFAACGHNEKRYRATKAAFVAAERRRLLVTPFGELSGADRAELHRIDPAAFHTKAAAR